jgi:prevent-host-death family protein
MTKTVNIHQAKTHLSRLIEEAMAGEEIIIAKAGKAKVRLAVVDAPEGWRAPMAGAGCMAGRIWTAQDAFDGTPAEDVDLWEPDGVDPR